MSSLHTLLVTNAAMSQTVRSLLAVHDDIHVAAEVHSPRDARDLLATLSVDLIIVQASLAGEDGFALLPYVPSGTQVVCLTGDAPEMMRALTYGWLACLPLPVQPRALAITLDRVRNRGGIPSLRSVSFA